MKTNHLATRTLGCGLLTLLLQAGSLPAAPLQVRDTSVATWEKTGVTILKGTVDLPRSVVLELPSFGTVGGLSEIYVNWDGEWDDMPEGERFAQIEDRKQVQQRRREVYSIYWQCRSHAREHGGIGPKTFAEVENLDQKSASTLHLMPGVRLIADDTPDSWAYPDIDEVVLLDLAPAIDDGKHWVARANGNVQRVEIDKELVQKHDLVIKPQALPFAQRLAAKEELRPVDIYARLTGDPGKVTIAARDFTDGDPLVLEWDTRNAAKGTPSQCQQWALQRFWIMATDPGPEAVIAATWAARLVDQYRLTEVEPDIAQMIPGSGEDRRNGNTTTVMGILGGRAAIEETLQLRNLQLADEDQDAWKPSVPIDDIPGVEVKAHPFEEMLDGAEGGRLPLADWIPHDHFLAYFPQPEKVFSLLDGGNDFLAAAGSGLSGRSISHGVKERYLREVGMSEVLLRRFLETGAIEEMAVTVPDLHFIDGTELSAVLRTGRPLLANAALALVGVPPGDGRTVRKTLTGTPVYWERRGNIVVVSTSEKELEAILTAHKDGKGLGQSAELRYMLTQVPVTEQTIAYTYFSDPFIRHLVGPRAKIGQFRRLLARREMEETAAGVLLASYDGQGEKATNFAHLLDHGYTRLPAFSEGLVLRDDGSVYSKRFGSPGRLESLDDLDLDRASAREKEAYDTYRDRYNDYWRRFFDPIAIRYEQDGDGGHALETFILPLIDNSIYGGLRAILPEADKTPPLSVPVIEPTPIAVLSTNLREEAWIETLSEVRDAFSDTLGLDPRLLDLIGPDVHLAVGDADPIITIGSGELQGLFGTFGSDSSEMMAISAFVSVLTRPTTIHIGLTDPDEARKLIKRMTWTPLEDNDWGFGEGSLYKLAGRDTWIYRYSIEDVITFRFSIEIQDRYLVINNQPFTHPVKVTGHRQAPRGAAQLILHPEACRDQAPALFASAAEQQRRNALASGVALLPLVLLGEEDAEAAATRHQYLFGYTPVHPGDGTWNHSPIDGLVSTVFGTSWSPVQPEFDPEGPGNGLMESVESAGVSMQFELDGLRTTARWKISKEE